MKTAPVLIMAGGTGGHIFPGLAVAAELQTRGIPVHWLGSTDGLETKLVSKANITLETLNIHGVRGKGWLALVAAPLRVMWAVWQACGILKRIHPRSVLSMGGFAAGPGGIAAWLMCRPLLVHEQNRIPGITNKILAKFAKKTLCGFKDSFSFSANLEWVGNPVRQTINEVAPPEIRYMNRSGALRVLVLGGSQGAYTLNLALPEILKNISEKHGLNIRHQSGEKHLAKTLRMYSDARVQAQVEAFIEDMAAAYAWADLVVCRAGALTLAEICAVGLPSILVPFPQAVDDHQTRNAEALVEAGAALLLPENQIRERLLEYLNDFSQHRSRLLSMAQAARRLAKPDATARIADYCLEVAAV